MKNIMVMLTLVCVSMVILSTVAFSENGCTMVIVDALSTPNGCPPNPFNPDLGGIYKYIWNPTGPRHCGGTASSTDCNPSQIMQSEETIRYVLPGCSGSVVSDNTVNKGQISWATHVNSCDGME